MDHPLAVVVWKWGTAYGPHHVNRLRAGVARHLRAPHSFWCITDDARGLDPRVCVAKLPPPLLPKVTPAIFSKAGMLRARRVQLFDPQWASKFGRRVLQVDLDTVIVGDVTPLVERSEPVVVLGASCQKQASKFGPGNPSLLLFESDALGELWAMYSADPTETYMSAHRTGREYADGALVGWYLNVKREAPWSWWDLQRSGIYHYWADIPRAPALPPDARVVMFMGARGHMEGTGGAPAPAWLAAHWVDDARILTP